MVAKLCLTTSATCGHASFHQEQGLSRASREFYPLLPGGFPGHEILRSASIQLKPSYPDDSRIFKQLCADPRQSAELSAIPKPVVVDVQDAQPHSVLFSYGIAEKCARHEKILQFLKAGTSSTEERGVDISLLCDVVGHHTLAINMHHFSVSSVDDDHCLSKLGAEPPLFDPRTEFFIPKPILNFVGDLSEGSVVTAHPDGKVLFTGTEAEVKDLLSVISEFYAKEATTYCKQAMLVPNFNWAGSVGSRSIVSSSRQLPSVTVAPLKSPEKLKSKPSPRKKARRKPGEERDLYRKNYFHACESLLSLFAETRRCRKTAIMSLRKSGPELPKLLTELSAGIAGTGLAVMFSVLCKIAGPRVPFSAMKLLNSGFGVGLVWLSWAVNGLRDAVVCVTKNPSRVKLTEDEMMGRVDRSLKEIVFRAATLMALAVFRFA